MDRWNKESDFKQRYDCRNDSNGDYHEPCEPVVHHLRQNQSVPEFSDRRPLKTWTPDKKIRNIADIPRPQLPKLPAAGLSPPIVNRDLKPGRQPKNIREPKPQSKGPDEKTRKAPPRPIRSLPNDHSDHMNTSSQFEFHSTSHTRDVASSSERERVSRSMPAGSRGSSTIRHSLDLETHEQDQRLLIEENDVRDKYRQKHHEWPQTKGDADIHNYIGHNKAMQASDEQDWYVGAFSRVEAEHALHLVNQEGAFLVRDCSKNTTQEPFVLAIFYDNRVFNVQIRYCTESCKYTLGTRVKTDDRFASVAEIIKFHSVFPIMLIDGRNPSGTANLKRHCVLVYPVTRQDVDVLLSKPNSS